MSTALEQQKEYRGVYPADVEYNSSAYIQIQNLNRTFQKQTGNGKGNQKEKFQVLSDINFSVLKGEFICIVGGSEYHASCYGRIGSGL